jgi:hypothetical protein
MADNTTLDTGSGGDTIRTEDRSGVKTPVSLLDVGGTGGTESIVGDAGVGLPVTGLGTAGTANAGVVTVQGIASMTAVQVGDNSGSLTVDAPVATPVFVRLSDGASAITTLPVSLASVPSHAVTNAGTFAVQVDGSALTSLQLIDDVVYVDDADFSDDASKFALTGGVYQSTPQTITDGDVGPFQVTANGYLIVSVNGTVTVGSHAVTNAGTFAVQAAQSGSWSVTANAGTDLNTSLLALETGGNLAGAATSLAILDDWDESDRAKVNLIVGQAGVAAGAGAVGATVQRITLASDDPAVTALQILDNVVSGNEAQVDIVAALPAGTNNIGDVDVLSVPQSIRGPAEPTIDSYTHASVSASANTADQSLVAAPGASKQIWVYGLFGTADTADGSIALQDEDNTALSGVMEVTRRGGFVIPPSGNFSMPWIKVATNKALEMDTVTCGFKGTISYAVVSV